MTEAAAIGVQQGDMVVGIKSDSDGDLKHTGIILASYYDVVKSNTLVRYGDVAKLGLAIGKAHDGEEALAGKVITVTDAAGNEFQVTTFHERDLGNKDSQSEQFFNKEKFKDFYGKHRGCKHFYLRLLDGWYYCAADSNVWMQINLR